MSVLRYRNSAGLIKAPSSPIALVRQRTSAPRSRASRSGSTQQCHLESLDEDRLGETLSVVWELEVGHSVTPAQGLPEHMNPESFDDPATLAGFVDAMRWGAVTSADPNRYQAPFWSGVGTVALSAVVTRSGPPLVFKLIQIVRASSVNAGSMRR